MQVDLFDDSRLVSEARRLSKQIETRDFKVSRNINEVKKQVAKEKPEFINEVENALNKAKRYERVGVSACDNYFLLEALGVGNSCKKYTIILDFSEKLDYVLHRLSGCETANIRKMPNYQNVSRDILNLNFRDLEDINFAEFLNLDPMLDNYLNRLINKAAENEFDEEVIVTNFINSFYNQILNELSCIKDYCIVALRAIQPDKSFIYRSKSFSSALASSDYKLNDELRITSKGYEDCIVNVKCYEKYDYLSEEAI